SGADTASRLAIALGPRAALRLTPESAVSSPVPSYGFVSAASIADGSAVIFMEALLYTGVFGSLPAAWDCSAGAYVAGACPPNADVKTNTVTRNRERLNPLRVNLIFIHSPYFGCHGSGR